MNIFCKSLFNEFMKENKDKAFLDNICFLFRKREPKLRKNYF